MKKLILTVLLGLFFTTNAYANYAADVNIREVVVFSDGYVHLSLTNPPATTCNHWGFEFRFDASTSGGDQMYKTLMAAKAMNKSISIGFGNSSAPGTNHDTGCGINEISPLWSVTF